MLTCLRTCSKMRWTVQHRPWRNTTLRRTSPRISKRNLTRSTTQHGTALWEETSAATSPTRRSTSSTSTWARWPSSCSNPAEVLQQRRRTFFSTLDQDALVANVLSNHMLQILKQGHTMTMLTVRNCMSRISY